VARCPLLRNLPLRTVPNASAVSILESFERIRPSSSTSRLDGDDLRPWPLSERKVRLRKLLRRSGDGIQYVEHAEGDGGEMYEAACKLDLEGILSKRLTAPYKSGPCKT
jgi:hypothetical protein